MASRPAPLRKWTNRAVSAALAAALACPSPARAQITPEPLEEMQDKADATRREDSSAKGTDFLVVPIPQASPTLGAGATLVGVLFYNPTGEPSPWLTGVGAMRTSNGSEAIAALHRMSLGHDRFRIVLFGGYAKININFYGIGPNAGERGVAIGLKENGYLGIAQAQYRVAPHLYAGIRSIFLDLSTIIRNPNPRFPDREIPTRQLDTRLFTAGPSLAYDRRDNLFTPHNGEYVTAVWMLSRPSIGSDFDYDKITFAANLYRPLGRTTVLAAHASLCSASKGGPFYDLCLYGAHSDLRGYEGGRYRDHASWTAQAELRQHLFGRFGAVAFGGIGGIAPSLSALGHTTFLPAGGLGLRYQPSRQTPINLRVDAAIGKDGKAIYVSLGEAF